MNKITFLAIVLSCYLNINAQNVNDSFRAYLYNNEYEIYLNIDFHEESVTVPGQELYGQLPGYLGKKNNSFCWLITSVAVTNNTARLSMINDFGSEDLIATLTMKDDSLYVLKQIEGSTLKVPKNGKWQKLPKIVEFKRR